VCRKRERDWRRRSVGKRGKAGSGKSVRMSEEKRKRERNEERASKAKRRVGRRAE
jgi:hypothetical protein